MAYLVQLLLPVEDNEGHRFGEDTFAKTRGELVERFGGVTAHLRAPARGVWKAPDGVDRDDIVILEVMTETLDRPWWARYREQVRERFKQDALVIRALSIDLL
jgi:hypothetical protein